MSSFRAYEDGSLKKMLHRLEKDVRVTQNDLNKIARRVRDMSIHLQRRPILRRKQSGVSESGGTQTNKENTEKLLDGYPPCANTFASKVIKCDSGVEENLRFKKRSSTSDVDKSAIPEETESRTEECPEDDANEKRRESVSSFLWKDWKARDSETDDRTTKNTDFRLRKEKSCREIDSSDTRGPVKRAFFNPKHDPKFPRNFRLDGIGSEDVLRGTEPNILFERRDELTPRKAPNRMNDLRIENAEVCQDTEPNVRFDSSVYDTQKYQPTACNTKLNKNVRQPKYADSIWIKDYMSRGIVRKRAGESHSTDTSIRSENIDSSPTNDQTKRRRSVKVLRFSTECKRQPPSDAPGRPSIWAIGEGGDYRSNQCSVATETDTSEFDRGSESDLVDNGSGRSRNRTGGGRAESLEISRESRFTTTNDSVTNLDDASDEELPVSVAKENETSIDVNESRKPVESWPVGSSLSKGDATEIFENDTNEKITEGDSESVSLQSRATENGGNQRTSLKSRICEELKVEIDKGTSDTSGAVDGASFYSEIKNTGKNSEPKETVRILKIASKLNPCAPSFNPNSLNRRVIDNGRKSLEHSTSDSSFSAESNFSTSCHKSSKEKNSSGLLSQRFRNVDKSERYPVSLNRSFEQQSTNHIKHECKEYGNFEFKNENFPNPKKVRNAPSAIRNPSNGKYVHFKPSFNSAFHKGYSHRSNSIPNYSGMSFHRQSIRQSSSNTVYNNDGFNPTTVSTTPIRQQSFDTVFCDRDSNTDNKNITTVQSNEYHQQQLPRQPYLKNASREGDLSKSNMTMASNLSPFLRQSRRQPSFVAVTLDLTSASGDCMAPECSRNASSSTSDPVIVTGIGSSTKNSPHGVHVKNVSSGLMASRDLSVTSEVDGTLNCACSVGEVTTINAPASSGKSVNILTTSAASGVTSKFASEPSGITANVGYVSSGVKSKFASVLSEMTANCGSVSSGMTANGRSVTSGMTANCVSVSSGATTKFASAASGMTANCGSVSSGMTANCGSVLSGVKANRVSTVIEDSITHAPTPIPCNKSDSTGVIFGYALSAQRGVTASRSATARIQPNASEGMLIRPPQSSMGDDIVLDFACLSDTSECSSDTTEEEFDQECVEQNFKQVY